MQSPWGPRIFWLVVLLLAGLGIYAYFYDPTNEEGNIAFSSPLAHMVFIGPKVAGCDIEIGNKDLGTDDWKGDVKLAKGKILQLYPRQADPSSIFSSTRFECRPLMRDNVKLPIILHMVYQAEPDDTLSLTVNQKTQKIPLAGMAADQQPFKALEGIAQLREQSPLQTFENDSASDDHHPCFFHDAQGRNYLLYMNSERSKGIDVNSVLAGSFESLETPILGTTLRLSRFSGGAWQYSEAVTGKLETCLDPAAAIDPTGKMFVAWLQKGLDGWDIYYKTKDFGLEGDSSLSWGKPVRLTTKSGYFQHLIAHTDSQGKVWLAWQSWRLEHCDIEAAVLNDDKHFMKTPGPVAEHPQDIDGRWFPTITSDKLGNTYLAWTVFRQGHFDIEVMKLFENMRKSNPIQLASSASDALRPSIACDSDNNLWVAYEESDPVQNYGELRLPESHIRVRTLHPDGSIDEWPALKMPASSMPAQTVPKIDPLLKPPSPVTRCIQPRMVISSEGLPIVVFQAKQKLLYSQWNNSAWTEPKTLSQTSPELTSYHTAIHQEGHLVDCHDTLDGKGRVRLQFAVANEGNTKPTIPRKPAPSQAAPPPTAWKTFAELARQFRKRSDDLVLNKRYLLRGLVVLPYALNEATSDPWAMACVATEQSLYDWIVIPHNVNSPAIEHWQTAQRAQVLTQQGDRNYVLGYYRPLVGSRDPLLLIDCKKDESPLLPLAQLESARRPGESITNRISVTQALDREIMAQYLSQRQRLGFSLTTDWQLLSVLTQPNTSDTYKESIERMLLHLWYPETTLAPMSGLRVVAVANGKSYDHLLDALRERHFYVATDDIYLTVRCEKHLPGDVFQTSFRPTISITAQGTAKLKSIEVWLDNKLIKSEEPPGKAALMEYKYEKSDRQWHSYTVRVTQENGAVAIVQPFWIRYLE
ncbi:MAG TPA: hypothetical protein PLN21_13465 [Gemmatales bacterium]|nr:hypothetical protein [Gemmatales bacterium]